MEDQILIQGELCYYAHRFDPELKQLHIVPISDVHYGNPLFSKRHFFRTIDYIANNPHVYTILNGDLCESTLKTSRGEIYKQAGSPQDQRDWITEKLYPIKDKILGMTIGNHEIRVWNEVGIDICKDIAKELHVPYRASGMVIKTSFGDGNKSTKGKPYVYWGYFTHGYGGARTMSAKAVKVKRTSTWIHVNWYAMSHDHVVNAAPAVYLIPDARVRDEKELNAEGKWTGGYTGFKVGKVSEHRKMLVKTNAYLKWGGYAEMGGFPPVDLETPIIKLMGEGKPKVRLEI